MTSAEEVKSKLDIADIIQDYIPLKKRGASYFAHCPFHQEKTPSFHVSKERQFYKCFGCGEGGDVFDFVQKMEGLEFPEALRLLAEKAGVKIEKFDPKIYTQKNRLLDLLNIAARFYHEVLLRSPASAEARNYLEGRGLKSSTVDLFTLGFSPNSWDSLLNFLISKKYTALEAFQAGLVVRRERGDGYYDRFRERIMFPIRDAHGRVVGFTARALPSRESDPKSGGKYINTPQTDFYSKSKVLYGLDMAKREIKNRDLAVLVEGNMDVIACHEFGMKNVVAASGTALTVEQVALLRRFTENAALSFDMDKAGELAAEKGIGLLLSAGMNVRVIQLPEGAGKDPDEAIRKNPDLWLKAVQSAKPVMEYLFSQAEAKYGRGGGEGLKNFAKMIIPFIARISDKIEQNFWLAQLSAVTGVTQDLLREEYLKAGGTKPMPQKEISSAKPAEPVSRFAILSECVLSLLIFSPQNFSFIVDRLAPEAMATEKLRRLYEAMILIYNNTGALKYADLRQKALEDGAKDELERLAISGETQFGEMPSDELQKETLAVLRELKDCYLIEKRKKLTVELALAERRGDGESALMISHQIQELLKLKAEHI